MTNKNGEELQPNQGNAQPGNGEDGEVVTMSKDEYDKMVQDLATERQSRVNLTGEIKELREKRQVEPAKPADNPQDVEALIQKKLAEQNSQVIKKNQDKALQRFFETHPEFKEENDIGGILLQKFEKTLSKLDRSSAAEVDDFVGLFEDTLRLMGRSDGNGSNIPANRASTPSAGGDVPSRIDKNLSDKEEKVVKQFFGGDVEKYLKTKAKDPIYMETVMAYVK